MLSKGNLHEVGDMPAVPFSLAAFVIRRTYYNTQHTPQRDITNHLQHSCSCMLFLKIFTHQFYLCNSYTTIKRALGNSYPVHCTRYSPMATSTLARLDPLLLHLPNDGRLATVIDVY